MNNQVNNQSSSYIEMDILNESRRSLFYCSASQLFTDLDQSLSRTTTLIYHGILLRGHLTIWHKFGRKFTITEMDSVILYRQSYYRKINLEKFRVRFSLNAVCFP